jgi:penicillin-binding protein 1A
MVSMIPDGAVVAMVGGSSYGESQFNRAVNALRQPGSSFKPFVYMAAFMNGYSPDSIVSDRPVHIGNWSPKNYGRSYSGPVTLKNALTRSINTIPVILSIDFGRDKIIETGYRMGLTHELENSVSLPIGSSEVSVIDMASSYSTLANGGYKATAYAVLEVKNSAGKVLYRREQDEPAAERVLPEDKVHQLNDILVNVIEAGTARRAQLDGVVAAGKTGTTNAYRDAWFVGYTGNFTTAVWFGNDDFTSTRRVTGGSLPAMAWEKYMAFAHNGIELARMPGVEPESLPRLARSAPAKLAETTTDTSQPRVLKRRTQDLLLKIGRDLRLLLEKQSADAAPGQAPAKTDIAAAQ